MSQLISVVIPCYNSAAYVKDAIASALDQTYPHVEVIVIDDGSTDGSIDILHSFGDRIYWETQANQGAPIARNRGLELAKGKYIKFLDADDILLPDCLEHQIQQAQQLDPGLKAIVYGDAIRIDQNGNTLPGYPLRPRTAKEDSIAHILSNSPLTSCPLHKREYLLEIGGFDPSLPRGQEHDLHLRLVLAGVNFLYYSTPIYQYREYVSDGRISQKGYSSKGAMFQYEILRKHQALIEQTTNQPLSKELRAVLAKRFWAFGRAVLREGYKNGAKQYFLAAYDLDRQNCIVGNVPYPQLVKILNPVFAEQCMSQLGKLKVLRRLNKR
ncbi:glycosyltransferase [Synechococcus sp. BDU 130192]|uniref:glycosyltransferase n=1 Tax=Synechococcus sp. BDU 130192 TaxID=2042059 RepID=UPI000C073472|nr:glycosyltransferase [Synechococcus sp. BDU 130192]